jgi:DNA-binding CsgD family transcriptional regulator
MPGGRLTQQDRQRIASALADGLSYAEIARRLHRTPSTISREIARNGGPAGYRAEPAHRATQRRARRRTPSAAPAAGSWDGEDQAVEAAMATGLPKMVARVLIRLWLSADGRLTAAELARGLGVSPASISTAVRYLVQQGLVRREPLGRRDVYVVDNDAWYRSMVTGIQQTLQAAQIAKESAARMGLDTAAGAQLAKGAEFLKRTSLDALESAERWRELLL